ncbi:hypothetical protein [Gillisia hiemivivida]|uniref:Auto-transporter adhesin head GIN domain-containing protein n=1 Tax=Gillisia hiemivivida TaxID=291190 RepID=A0A5C6ZPD8_9FLAO|nr:hypothetical protein [Gillisia hiemivivida]TXD92526.1 hypothetical protein ES724_13640 [Gillisia hiemivivida]
MKKTVININIFLFLLIAFSQLANSQTYLNAGTGSSEELLLKNDNLTLAALNGLGIFNNQNLRNIEITGNEVFLTQIGDFNQADIKTITASSEIIINQLGASNWATVDYEVNTAIANFVQNGDFNTIHDYVISPEADISLELTQEGNGKYFERNGVNELTKSLKFNQTDATPILIINSYK